MESNKSDNSWAGALVICFIILVAEIVFGFYIGQIKVSIGHSPIISATSIEQK